MKKQVLLALLFSGILAISAVIFLFSWLSDPVLSRLGWLPEKVGRWADQKENINIRTAIPMLVWGFLAGIILFFKQAKLRWWILSGLAGTILVAIAELGQIWIPDRHPDWGDIFWGCLGLNSGLLFVRAVVWYLPRCKWPSTYSR